MNPPKKVIAIDDLPGNFTLWSDAFNTLKPHSEFHETLITDNEDLDDAVGKLSAPGCLSNSLVLLDLGFQSSFTKTLPSASALIEKLCERLDNGSHWCKNQGLSFPYKGSAIPIEPEACEGLSLLETILSAKPKQCLVFLVSGRGANDAVKYFLKEVDEYANTHELSISFTVGGEMPKKNVMAQHLLREGLEAYANRFPTFHSSQSVNGFLSKWISSYNSIPQHQRPNFCTHGNPNTAFSIEGSPNQYRELITEIFGVAPELGKTIGDNDLKAIFQLDSGPATDQDGLFPISDTSLGSANKLSSAPLVSAMLNGIFESDVASNGSPELRLPCRPALPFLLSLLALKEEMDAQDGGMIDITAKLFLSVADRDGPCRLTIPLRKREEYRGAICARWQEKMRDFPQLIDSASGGVCPALWDVLVARVRGINESSQSDPGDKALLQLFRGPGRLVAGVTFGPYYIHIHW